MKNDGSGDLDVIFGAIILIVLIAIVLGVAGLFYPPSLKLLTCLYGHLSGTGGGNCI